MIFGKIEKDEEIIKFNLELKCVNCKKKVPGGMKSGKSYFETDEFNKNIDEFKKTYLCGVCRDMKRTQIKN